MIQTYSSLYYVVQEVQQGVIFNFVNDLAKMINSSTNAMLVFRRIPIALAMEYHFDRNSGFSEDKDGTGWHALDLFWNLCQLWDLPDREFFSRGDYIVGDYTKVIDDIDKLLAKYPNSNAHLFWGAMKTAFYQRTVQAHA